MIYSANAVPVTPAFSAPATFSWPGNAGAVKISGYINGTDAVLQVLEEKETGWQDDQSQEILLRQGFNTREFVTPIFKYRFKTWSGTTLATSGTIDIVAMS